MVILIYFLTILDHLFATTKTHHYFIAEVADNCSLRVAFIGGKQGAVRTYNFAIFFVFVQKSCHFTVTT